jgi:hypothetical protein
MVVGMGSSCEDEERILYAIGTITALRAKLSAISTSILIYWAWSNCSTSLRTWTTKIYRQIQHPLKKNLAGHITVTARARAQYYHILRPLLHGKTYCVRCIPEQARCATWPTKYPSSLLQMDKSIDTRAPEAAIFSHL